MSTSPYYPPRAGRRSRFLAAMNRLRIRMRAPHIDDSAVQEIGVFIRGIPWLLIPGLMWRQQGRTALGACVAAAWVILVAIFIISLDEFIANAAAMLAATLHAISAAAVLMVLCPHWQGFSRIWRTTLFTSLLVLALYTVGLRNMLPPFAQRLTSNGTTVMIHQAKWFARHPWTQGEWVAYRLPAGGTNFDRILALPGDTIRFHRDSFEVNGRLFERVSPLMPTDGEEVLTTGTYFIWPTEASFAHAGGNQQNLLLGLATIGEDDILGRPYRRWFWKSPVLKTLKPLPDTAHPSPP